MRNKYSDILRAIRTADIKMFGLAFLTFLLTIVGTSYRLKLIVRAQDINVTMREAISLSFIGYFFNNFLPTAIGGDVVKGYYLSKKSDNATGSYTSVFVDRAIGLVTMVFMAFVALLIAEEGVVDPTVRYSIYAITAIAVAGVFFLANKRFAKMFSGILFLIRPLEDKLRKLYNAANKYRHHKLLMLQTLVISVVSQLLYFAVIGFLAVSIGSFISPVNILLRMPIVGMISLLPSINGLGVREGATVVFFGPLIGSESAFVVSILMIALLLIISIMGGLIYLVSPQFKVKLKEMEKGGPA